MHRPLLELRAVQCRMSALVRRQANATREGQDAARRAEVHRYPLLGKVNAGLRHDESVADSGVPRQARLSTSASAPNAVATRSSESWKKSSGFGRQHTPAQR
jgi:hypothetical protein